MKQPCQIPTDPEQKIIIHCACCGTMISFRKKEVFTDEISYLCGHCINIMEDKK